MTPRWLLILALVVIPILYLSAYWLYPKPLQDGGDYGTLGDFIGGVLNPLLAYLSFIAVVFTIRFQQEEALKTDLTRHHDQILASQTLQHAVDEAKAAKADRGRDQAIAEENLRQIRQEAELNEITRLLTALETSLDDVLGRTLKLQETNWAPAYDGSLVNFLNLIVRNCDPQSGFKIGREIRKLPFTPLIFMRTGETLHEMNLHLVEDRNLRGNPRLLRHFQNKYVAVVRSMYFLGFLEREDISVLIDDDDLHPEPWGQVF